MSNNDNFASSDRNPTQKIINDQTINFHHKVFFTEGYLTTECILIIPKLSAFFYLFDFEANYSIF